MPGGDDHGMEGALAALLSVGVMAGGLIGLDALLRHRR
jgi:hypothetical protein